MIYKIYKNKFEYRNSTEFKNFAKYIKLSKNFKKIKFCTLYNISLIHSNIEYLEFLRLR
jgi:hypothetical protein